MEPDAESLYQLFLTENHWKRNKREAELTNLSTEISATFLLLEIRVKFFSISKENINCNPTKTKLRKLEQDSSKITLCHVLTRISSSNRPTTNPLAKET